MWISIFLSKHFVTYSVLLNRGNQVRWKTEKLVEINWKALTEVDLDSYVAVHLATVVAAAAGR